MIAHCCASAFTKRPTYCLPTSCQTVRQLFMNEKYRRYMTAGTAGGATEDVHAEPHRVRRRGITICCLLLIYE
jgi:hypothetical protein